MRLGDPFSKGEHLRFSCRFSERLTKIVHQKWKYKGFYFTKNFFCGTMYWKSNFSKLVRTRSILAVRITKFRALSQPIRILVFLADQFSHVINIDIKQSFFQTSLSFYISFKFVHAFVLYRLTKANTF